MRTEGTTQETPPQLPWTLRSVRWLDQRHPAFVLAVGMMLILCIGGVGFVTGPQLSTSLLYLVPLLLITRVAGLRAGVAAALLAAGLWLATDLRSSPDFTHRVTPYWNMLMRFGTFLVAVGLVASTKSLNAHLEERVSERTAELEKQIAENRDLEKAILEISDRERANVGQDLHDGLCQQLVGTAFTASLLRDKIATDPEACAGDVERIADMIDDSITQARNLARGLYPVRLETEGLEMAVRELASTMSQRHGVRCEVECPAPLPPLRENIAIQLYRIVQEAVTNAAKHARADHISIHLGSTSARCFIETRDDGVGIAHTKRNPAGMGLSIMEYRARMIGADFHIEDRKPHGTVVRCEVIQ